MISIRRHILLLSFMASGICAMAQRQRVVVDGDTGQPIANVSIAGKGFTVVADSLGRFTLPKECKTLVFSHIGYYSYMANLNDVGDSVALYSSDLRLDEVVVFGKPTGRDPLHDLNSRLSLSPTEAQLLTANPNGNLLGLLTYLIPKKWRTSKKQRRKEQLKTILESY